MNILYQSNISTKENNSNKKAYIGITSLDWKFRYYNHLQSFRTPNLKIKLPYLSILISKRTTTNTYYKLENN